MIYRDLRFGDRGGAIVVTRLRGARSELGLDDGDAQRERRERDREAGADEAAAGDEDVAGTGGHAARALRLSRISASICAGALGTDSVRTSGSRRVTSTSSSIRMPMPHQRFATPRVPGAM